MIKTVCSIKDEIADAWMTPQFAMNEQAALRSLMLQLDRDQDFRSVVKDYNLYKIGMFNELTGELEGCAPVLIVAGANIPLNGDSPNEDA